MRKTICAAFICAVALTVGVQFSKGQKVDVWKPVPIEHTESLKSRLAEFTLAHKEKDWPRVFDFLGTQYRNSSNRPLAKAEFIEKKLYSKVKKFTVKGIVKMDDGWLTIEGCGAFSNGGNMEAGLEAFLENGTWYFSDIWSSPQCVDCRPRDCKH